MLIYKITNKINNKVYIGQTSKTLEERIKRHKRDSENKNTYFYKAVRKYGWDNFTWEIIEDNIKSHEELNEKEKYYIKLYQSFIDKTKGYNSTSGGDYGYEVSDEEKKKRSIHASGKNNPMYNKPGTWLGKHFSQEHKKHLSEAQKGIKKPSIQGEKHYNAKKIINLTTGEIYGSIADASKKYQVTADAISNCLRKKTKTCCGYEWDYLDNINIKNFKPINPTKKPVTQKRTIYVLEMDKTFKSLSEASKILQCSASLISIKCSKLKKDEYGLVKGYHVKYV